MTWNVSPPPSFEPTTPTLSLRVAGLLSRSLAKAAVLYIAAEQNKAAEALLREVSCYQATQPGESSEIVLETRKGIKLGYDLALSDAHREGEEYGLQPLHEAIMRISWIVEKGLAELRS